MKSLCMICIHVTQSTVFCSDPSHRGSLLQQQSHNSMFARAGCVSIRPCQQCSAKTFAPCTLLQRQSHHSLSACVEFTKLLSKGGQQTIHQRQSERFTGTPTFNYSSSHITTRWHMVGAVMHAIGQHKWHLGQGAHCPALISSVPGAAGTLKPALARSSLQRLARAWLDSSPDDSSLCTLPCTLQHHICEQGLRGIVATAQIAKVVSDDSSLCKLY